MNPKRILVFIAALAAFLSPQILLGQSIPLGHYSSKDGLTSSVVTRIIQDSAGWLWFGTEHGLNRFNGVTFQNILAEKNVQKNDYIMDLVEGRNGNLWVGTREGGLICIAPGGVKTYTSADGLSDNRISSIVEDNEGNLWLGTGSGLNMFNGKSFTTYTTKDGLPDDFIYDIIIDKGGKLWIGTEKGLSYLTRKNGNIYFSNYTTDTGLINNTVQTLMMDHKGNIWIGTKGGLCCREVGKTTEAATFISYTTKDGLANNYVNAIIEDINRNIWIGTDSGISRLSPSSGKFTNFFTKHGLPHDRILTIFEDREGNIWFGTSMGASRLHSFRITNFSDKDGLPNNLIWSIIEEREGKYWIGTDKGLARYFEGKFNVYTTREGLIGNNIFQLIKDKPGNIWAATNAGVSVYSLKSGTFTNYTKDDGLPNEVVISLAQDSSGTIWIGTTMGLSRFINGKLAPPNFNFKSPALPVHTILPDRRGNLWFSDSKRLWKTSGSGKKIANYTTKDGLIYNKIKFLFEDSRGRIWIGTRQGLSCFSNGKFTNYTTADGLSHNACFFMTEDDSGNLWIGTGNGVNRFDGKSFKTYTSRDGLISNEMKEGACLKDSRGNLWFGTANGISRLDPRLDRKNTVPPPVYITDFSVWGKRHPISPNIQLKYNQNYLKFDFIGLCFTSPEDVVYKHRLEGVDRDWIETGNRDTSYSSLAPGDYSFKVIAKNNDGIESLKPAEIRFCILPPFWQTWWFWVVSLLVLAAAIVMIVLFKIKRVKEKVANEEKNKQLIMAQRMKLLGVLAGGAVHDLKNLLGIIIGYSELVVAGADEGEEVGKEEAIDVIKSTADTAFQVVKQMMAFTRQSADESTPSDLSDLIEELLEILRATVSKTVTIRWKAPKDEMLLYINPIKFKQVVLNLSLNAVQAMKDKGELKLSLFKDPAKTGQIILEVSDTGPGIKQEIQDKIFTPLFTTREEEKGAGLGLFVVKQIVDEYEGKIRIRSKPGEGTTFSVSFPVREPAPKKLTAN